MEHIEILTPDIADCPAFVANNAVNAVQIPTTLVPVNMRSGISAQMTFAQGDNFNLLSAGYFIPERFCLYEATAGGGAESPVPLMRIMAYQTVTAASVPLVQFGNNGVVRVPFPNYEHSMGVFVDAYQTILEAFVLQVVFPLTSGADAWWVSMVNVPVALNGVTFHIVPFVKVLHNYDLL